MKLVPSVPRTDSHRVPFSVFSWNKCWGLSALSLYQVLLFLHFQLPHFSYCFIFHSSGFRSFCTKHCALVFCTFAMLGLEDNSFPCGPPDLQLWQPWVSFNVLPNPCLEAPRDLPGIIRSIWEVPEALSGYDHQWVWIWRVHSVKGICCWLLRWTNNKITCREIRL